MNATRTETSHFLAELLFRDSRRKEKFVIGIPNDSFSFITEQKQLQTI